MDTFCGCDTAALDDLSSMVGERAAHLGAVMEGVAQVVATTDWFGPDEQGFQEQLDEVYERARELFERLRELGELLREESAEQSACSQPDGQSATWRDGLRALRSELPRARSEEHTSELQSRFDLVCRLLLEKKNKVLIYLLDLLLR